jgi:hypothetical protein
VRERAYAEQDRLTVQRYEREEAYRQYRSEAIDRHLALHMRPEDFAALTRDMANARRQQYKSLPADTIAQIAERDARNAIAERLNLPTFEEFSAKLDKGATAPAA